MSDEPYKTRDMSAADIQIGGAGYRRDYYPCTGVGGPTQELGAINPIYCPDPNNPSGVAVIGTIRDAPALPTFDIMQYYALNQYLSGLECEYNLYARHFCGGARHDPENYDQILFACGVQMQTRTWDGLVSMDETNAKILVTGNMTARDLFLLWKMAPAARILDTYAELYTALNYVWYCDIETCGDCGGARSDGCQRWYAVGDDRGPGYAYGANPILLMYDGTKIGAANKRRVREITGLLGNAIFGFCIGGRVFAFDNAGNFAWINDPWDAAADWTIVTDQFEAGASPTAAYVSGRTVYLSALGGYVYKSVDGGMTYETVEDGGTTAEDLNAIAGLGDLKVVAVGDNGAAIKTTNGGETWEDIDTGAAVDLACVAWPRSSHIYAGANDGLVYYTYDGGEEWLTTAVIAVGGTISILDIAFCGGCAGEVGWLLIQDADGDPHIARSIDGGYSWEEEVTLPANTPQLNSIDCCSPNEFIAVGELWTGANPYAAVVNGHPKVA